MKLHELNLKICLTTDNLNAGRSDGGLFHDHHGGKGEDDNKVMGEGQ